MDFVATKPVGCTELTDLGPHLVLLRLQPCESVHPPGQSYEIIDDSPLTELPRCAPGPAAAL